MLVLRDGDPLKLRTRQQALLLARLVVEGGRPLDRDAITESLWPEAEPENARAYLRRAVAELRAHGFDLRAERGTLLLIVTSLTSDLAEARDAKEISPIVLGDESVLTGLDHPVADEIRATLLREFARRHSRGKRSKSRPEAVRTDAWSWLGRRFLETSPESALTLVVDSWGLVSMALPPDELLQFLTDVLTANSANTPDRGRLLGYAGYAASLLTHYGEAERLCLQAIESSETQDSTKDSMRASAYAYSILTMVMLETRQWERGYVYGLQAAEMADRTENPASISLARNNLAGIQWHRLEFEASAENYRLAIEATGGPIPLANAALVVRANAAFLRAIYGVEISFQIEPPQEMRFPQGYGGVPENYLRFCLAFGRKEVPAAAEAAALLLEHVATEHMERYLTVALDIAAFTFVLGERPQEAAACVRLGSRLRYALSHKRSPAEALAVRRHVRTSLFGSSVVRLTEAWWSDDLQAMAHRVADRLWSLRGSRAETRLP
ncbi:hypothetical protein EON81_22075 [bacterium]|nr:MAG: hypothetical protein EON81_22075 [bacterium]